MARIRPILFPIFYAQKKCPNCGSQNIWKNGRQSGRQRYKCSICKYIFVRQYAKEKRWVASAYQAYALQRQTLADLSRTYSKDPKTIRKYFDIHCPVIGEIVPDPEPINLVMDGTFFKAGDGYMVARARSRNLYWFSIETEKVEHYGHCLDALETAGFTFASFTIDGRRGVRQMLEKRNPGTPIQYCHFHQIQTITIKLTKRPKLPAGKELRAIVLTLSHTTRKEFTAELDKWHERWSEFMKERTYSEERKRKWRYVHEKLRSAYFSIKRNLPWLFTYLDYPELNIPNTTNSCDGSFGHWKSKIKIHRGIRKSRKKKMIDFMLER